MTLNIQPRSSVTTVVVSIPARLLTRLQKQSATLLVFKNINALNRSNEKQNSHNMSHIKCVSKK